MSEGISVPAMRICCARVRGSSSSTARCENGWRACPRSPLNRSAATSTGTIWRASQCGCTPRSGRAASWEGRSLSIRCLGDLSLSARQRPPCSWNQAFDVHCMSLKAEFAAESVREALRPAEELWGHVFMLAGRARGGRGGRGRGRGRGGRGSGGGRGGRAQQANSSRPQGSKNYKDTK